MRQRSPILYFLIVFGVTYSVLAFVYPGQSQRYSVAYRGVCNWLFGDYGDRGVVTFAPMETPNRNSDTEVITALRGSRYSGVVNHSPHLTGFLPTVEFIALALATPITWRRRLVGLGVGLAVLHVAIALRIRIALLYWFSTSDTQWQIHEFGAGLRRLISLLHESVNVAPVASFVIPGIVWLVVMFRLDDWGGAFRFGADELTERQSSGE